MPGIFVAEILVGFIASVVMVGYGFLVALEAEHAKAVFIAFVLFGLIRPVAPWLAWLFHKKEKKLQTAAFPGGAPILLAFVLVLGTVL